MGVIHKLGTSTSAYTRVLVLLYGIIQYTAVVPFEGGGFIFWHTVLVAVPFVGEGLIFHVLISFLSPWKKKKTSTCDMNKPGIKNWCGDPLHPSLKMKTWRHPTSENTAVPYYWCGCGDPLPPSLALSLDPTHNNAHKPLCLILFTCDRAYFKQVSLAELLKMILYIYINKKTRRLLVLLCAQRAYGTSKQRKNKHTAVVWSSPSLPKYQVLVWSGLVWCVVISFPPLPSPQ